MDYKKCLRNITILFMGILIAFTFFSQTLADMRIARVNLTFSQTRTVVPEVHSAGTVMPLNTLMLFAPVDGAIVQLAELGYQGLSASVVFTIHSDVQRLQEQLTQAQDEQRLIALNVERVQNDRALEQQRINQLNAEAPTRVSLVEYDLQLIGISDQLEITQSALESQEALYAQGLGTRQAVAESENMLAALELAREQILARRDLAETRQAEAIAGQGRARDTQLQLHQSAISQLDVQLRIHAMESERIAARIYELTQQIAEGGLVEVPVGGNRTIIDIMPGIVAGARVSEGTPIMMTAVRDGLFRVTAPFAQNIEYIERLEERMPAYVHFGALEVTGRVARIFPDGDQIMVAVDVESTRFSGGERAMVRIQGRGVHSRQVIPRSALRVDTMGYYMLYVEAVERLFGLSYYARIQRIDGIEARGIDGYIATILNMGVSPITEPIITHSDMPVYAGDRVRPVEAGDFFETR